MFNAADSIVEFPSILVQFRALAMTRCTRPGRGYSIPIRSTLPFSPPHCALVLLLGLTAALGLPPSSLAGDSPGFGEDPEEVSDPLARVTLITENPSGSPGGTVMLGVHLQIQEGWHVYWDGLNDTGYPVSVDLELPAGVTAGEMLWPAPERHISPGNILDHVYVGEVTLLVPLTVSGSAAVGSSMRVDATVNWLACREACIPGSARAQTTFQVEPAEDTSGNGDPRVAVARSRLPGPAPERLTVGFEPGTPEGSESGSGGFEGWIAMLAFSGADRLAFYPASACVPLANPIEDATAQAGRLRLRLAPEQDADGSRLMGVLEVEQAGSLTFFTVDSPINGES